MLPFVAAVWQRTHPSRTERSSRSLATKYALIFSTRWSVQARPCRTRSPASCSQASATSTSNRRRTFSSSMPVRQPVQPHPLTLTPRSETQISTIEAAFQEFTERKDVAILLINQHVRTPYGPVHLIAHDLHVNWSRLLKRSDRRSIGISRPSLRSLRSHPRIIHMVCQSPAPAARTLRMHFIHNTL